MPTIPHDDPSSAEGAEERRGDVAGGGGFEAPEDRHSPRHRPRRSGDELGENTDCVVELCGRGGTLVGRQGVQPLGVHPGDVAGSME